MSARCTPLSLTPARCGEVCFLQSVDRMRMFMRGREAGRQGGRHRERDGRVAVEI